MSFHKDTALPVLQRITEIWQIDPARQRWLPTDSSNVVGLLFIINSSELREKSQNKNNSLHTKNGVICIDNALQYIVNTLLALKITIINYIAMFPSFPQYI